MQKELLESLRLIWNYIPEITYKFIRSLYVKILFLELNYDLVLSKLDSF